MSFLSFFRYTSAEVKASVRPLFNTLPSITIVSPTGAAFKYLKSHFSMKIYNSTKNYIHEKVMEILISEFINLDLQMNSKLEQMSQNSTLQRESRANSLQFLGRDRTCNAYSTRNHKSFAMDASYNADFLRNKCHIGIYFKTQVNKLGV